MFKTVSFDKGYAVWQVRHPGIRGEKIDVVAFDDLLSEAKIAGAIVEESQQAIDAKECRIKELESALREVRSSIVKSYTDVGLMTPWQAETRCIVVSIDKVLGGDT